MTDNSTQWAGEATFRWAVPDLFSRQHKCLLTGDGSLTEREVLEFALASVCDKASSFAVPPRSIFMEVEFDSGRWGILGARWREGGFVHRSGIVAIEAPDDRVSVQILEEITDSGEVGEEQ